MWLSDKVRILPTQEGQTTLRTIEDDTCLWVCDNILVVKPRDTKYWEWNNLGDYKII